MKKKKKQYKLMVYTNHVYKIEYFFSTKLNIQISKDYAI